MYYSGVSAALVLPLLQHWLGFICGSVVTITVSVNTILAWLSAEFSDAFQNPYYFPVGATYLPASMCLV